MESHYHPAIAQRLRALTTSRDWQEFPVYLESLSNAQFRTAGYMIGEQLIPSLSERDAWALIDVLLQHNTKAFLVTLLKAIRQGITKKTLNLHSDSFKAILRYLSENAIDTQKVLQNLLPALTRPEDIEWLFHRLAVEEGAARVPHLVRVCSMPASYALFRTLRYAEHDRTLLLRVARFLVRRGDALAFNLASVMRTYYGLDEVQGTFSLRIEPYQLARLDSSYEAFCEVLKR